MSSAEYTPEGLPVIKEEILEVIERDLRQGDKELSKDSGLMPHAKYNFLGAEMLGHNDALHLYGAEWAGRFIANTEDVRRLGIEDMAMAFEFGFSLCYEAMRRQAETNRLEE